MKLYYDTLIPFMPEQYLNGETGELTQDTLAIAHKNALIKLSDYQITKNIVPLYHAIIELCAKYDTSIVKVISDTSCWIPPVFDSSEELIDRAAMMLFGFMDCEDHKINLVEFTGLLLTAIHTEFELSRNHQATIESDEPEVMQAELTDIEESTPIDIDNLKFIDLPGENS